MNILIVDDSEPMRRVIKSLIVDLAEQCFECANGAEACDLYTLHRPDWVLMDLRMSGMDGLTATKNIIAAYPDARIVIVTSYDGADLQVAAQSAGACAFVSKKDLTGIRTILTRS